MAYTSILTGDGKKKKKGHTSKPLNNTCKLIINGHSVFGLNLSSSRLIFQQFSIYA